MDEFVNQLAQTVDPLGWLGFFVSPCVMFGGMATAIFARRKAIISTRTMFTLVGLVSLISGCAAGRILYAEPGKVFFVSVALATASLFGFLLAVRDPYARSKVVTEVSQRGGTPRDHARFHAGLVSVAIAYVGVWSTFATVAYPPLAASGWHNTIVIVLVVGVIWTVVGLHLIVGRVARARDTSGLRACHLVMAISASPAVLGLTLSRLTGNRWAGFLLMPLSLIILWLEMHRLEKAFASAEPSR